MNYRWYQPLRVKKISGKKTEQTIRMLSQNRYDKNVWLVVLPFGEHNLLDIYPSYVFLQKEFPFSCADVVGMAKNRRLAMELAAELVEEVYRATGSFDTRVYYRDKMKWEERR